MRIPWVSSHCRNGPSVPADLLSPLKLCGRFSYLCEFPNLLCFVSFSGVSQLCMFSPAESQTCVTAVLSWIKQEEELQCPEQQGSEKEEIPTEPGAGR